MILNDYQKNFNFAWGVMFLYQGADIIDFSFWTG